ncbi:MAG: hypothetical protein H6814_08995 [Phycisphaeraceae bacterium]|nr:hypothetical protein [Phycisphaeraceae bacterium]
MTTNQHYSDVVIVDLLTDLIARTEHVNRSAERLSRRRIPRAVGLDADASERRIASLLLDLHGLHAQLGAAIVAMERRELRKLLR